MKLVCLSLCGLIGVLNLTGCSRKSTPAIPAAPEVLVTTVAPRDVPVIKEGVATLNGFINAKISARVSGYVISQNYEQGSVVKKGDLLFQIDPSLAQVLSYSIGTWVLRNSSFYDDAGSATAAADAR